MTPDVGLIETVDGPDTTENERVAADQQRNLWVSPAVTVTGPDERVPTLNRKMFGPFENVGATQVSPVAGSESKRLLRRVHRGHQISVVTACLEAAQGAVVVVRFDAIRL